jgi:hypothetical protein
VWFTGRPYLIRPLLLRHFATIETHILAERQTPIDAVLPEIHRLNHAPAIQRQILERAYLDTYGDRKINRVATNQILAWMNAPSGMLFTYWLCLRSDTGQRLGWNRISRLLSRATIDELDELRRRRDLVSGLDLMARLDWPEERNDPDDDPEWWKRICEAKGTPRSPRVKTSGIINWREILHYFAKEPFSWDANRVGRLTLYQLQTYRSDPESFKRSGGMSKFEGEHAKPEFIKQYLADRARMQADEAAQQKRRAAKWADAILRRE